MKADAAFIVLVAGLLRSVTSTSPAEISPRAGAWQNNLTTVHSRLQHLYTSGHYSDLTIEFPKDKKNVSVHRLVLSMSSPVFGTMLMGSSPVGDELAIQDSHKTFMKLLDHIYLDKMDLQSVDEALRVYATSYKYQIHSANSLCSKYIINHLTEEKTLAAFEASLAFADEDLKKTCVTILSLKADDTIAPTSVSKLKKETLKGLLQGELHVSSETLIFSAVLAWGKAQLSQRGEEVSSSALRTEVEDLLREVRFLTMTCEEFIDSVLPASVLSPAEAIYLLRAIRGADVSLIPESTPFSPSTKSRTRTVNDLIRQELSCNSRSYSYEYINANHWTAVVNNLKSTDQIIVHSLIVTLYGDIRIRSQDGTVNAFARSSNNNFTFGEPFLLKPDETYTLSVKPKSRLRFERPSRNSVSSESSHTTLTGTFVYCINTVILFWKT